MEEDYKRVVANDMFNRLVPTLPRELRIAVLDGPAGIGDDDGAVDQCRDTGA